MSAIKLHEAIDKVAKMLARKRFDDYMGGGYGLPSNANVVVEVLVMIYGCDANKGDIEDAIFDKQKIEANKLEAAHRAAYKAHILK